MTKYYFTINYVYVLISFIFSMEQKLFEWFNVTPEKSIEFSEYLRDYFFINTDTINEENIEYLSKKILGLISEYSSENIQTLHSQTSSAKSLANILIENWYDSISQRKMHMWDTHKKISPERKKEALAQIEEELWTEMKSYISWNKVDWEWILWYLYNEKKDIILFWRRLSRNFIRYMYEKQSNFWYVYFQCFGYSLADKSIEEKENEFHDIFWPNKQTPKLTIFIWEESFGNMLKYSQNKRSDQVNRSSDLKNKIFLLPKRESSWVLEVHKNNTGEKRTKLIRDAIKTINILTGIYTNPTQLFTIQQQEDTVNILSKLRKSKNANSVRNSIHNQFITEIEMIVKKIKYVQLWRTVNKVKTYIKGRISLYEKKEDNIENIDTKRRVWGRLLFETLDDWENLDTEINALILEMSEFIDSTVWREYFQSIEKLLRLNSEKLLQITTSDFDGGNLLEFILVDILSSIEWKNMNWKFTKWNNDLDSDGKIDFMFQSKNSHLGYQLFAWSKNSTFKKKKIRILRDIQSKINNEEEDITIVKRDGREIVFEKKEFPQTLLLAHLEMTPKERKLLSEYYEDFDVRKQSSIITSRDYQDSLSDKILSFSEALREITYMLHTLNGKMYEELLNWELKAKSGILMIWTTHKWYVEIMIRHEWRYIWSIDIFDTKGMRIKRRKYKEKTRPKESRKNGRSPKTRKNWSA